jgi:hypothetical protein
VIVHEYSGVLGNKVTTVLFTFNVSGPPFYHNPLNDPDDCDSGLISPRIRSDDHVPILGYTYVKPFEVQENYHGDPPQWYIETVSHGNTTKAHGITPKAHPEAVDL